MVVGLVGCGHWGVNILRDLRALGCEVRVVARSAASVARAQEGGAADIVPKIGELGAVDGIVTSTPIATQAAVIEEALTAGVPVFTEKPLCDDVEDAARLVALGLRPLVRDGQVAVSPRHSRPRRHCAVGRARARSRT